MLTCSQCKIKLKSNYFYLNRKRIKVGQFCPSCCRIFSFTGEFKKYQDELTKKIQERAKKKPRLRKQRHACPYCMEKGIVNRQKWKIRKMNVKQGDSPHWKCTCQRCGKVWTQNTPKEYYYIDQNLPKPEELMGAGL